jgi:hypothetical protein
MTDKQAKNMKISQQERQQVVLIEIQQMRLEIQITRVGQ